MLDDLKMIHQRDVQDALGQAERQVSEFDVAKAAQSWLATVPTVKNQAKQIAQDCIGKSIVIYSGPELSSVAQNWKIGFNQNAKQLAWLGQDDDFIGWTKQPNDKPYAVIDLRSSLDSPRVTRRFEVLEQILSGLRPTPIIIEAQGKDWPAQILWASTLGNFVTIYTALLSGINPSQIDLIDKFNRLMEA